MSLSDLEIVQWFCYRRQEMAGVITLRRSDASYAVDWLLQDKPPTPAVLAHGYLAGVVTAEAYADGRSARQRFSRLRGQMADFITGEGGAIHPEDSKEQTHVTTTL